MYTRFILFGFVTSNGPSDPKSSCKSPAQCPPPPHSLVPSTQEVAMVRERDVPDGRLTSSNGSVWPPSHDWHIIPAESLHSSAPMARFFLGDFFSQCRTFSYLRYSSNVPSRIIFFSRLFDTEDFSGTLRPVGRLTYCDSIAFPQSFPQSLCFLNVSYSPFALSRPQLFSSSPCIVGVVPIFWLVGTW